MWSGGRGLLAHVDLQWQDLSTRRQLLKSATLVAILDVFKEPKLSHFGPT